MLDGDSISAGFSKNGMSIISLGYSYQSRPCEPNGVVVPFSLFKPYLNTTAPFMKSANLEAK